VREKYSKKQLIFAGIAISFLIISLVLTVNNAGEISDWTFSGFTIFMNFSFFDKLNIGFVVLMFAPFLIAIMTGVSIQVFTWYYFAIFLYGLIQKIRKKTRKRK
jgi:hypothetical protein